MDSKVANDDPLGKIVEFLQGIRRKGITLSAENGQLRYKAPRGALTQDEMEILRTYKASLIDLLERANAAKTSEPTPESGSQSGQIPLTYTQLAHWNLYRLRDRPSFSSVLSATRIHGNLDTGALQAALTRVILHHAALRTRITVVNDVPVQEVAVSADCIFKVQDLSEFSQPVVGDKRIMNMVQEIILEPIAVDRYPLLGVRLLKLAVDHHVLVITIEHIVADHFSLGILWRDLLFAYTQVVKGRRVSLPPVTMQFPDYAMWQQRAHGAWLEQHGRYWANFAARHRCPRFPSGMDRRLSPHLGWEFSPFRIDEELRSALIDWSRRSRTTLVMSVFTAYIAFVLRWCDVSGAVFLYQTNGRTGKNVANTIGYFASPLYLYIEFAREDSFTSLLGKVTAEYGKAFLHSDSCYMEAQVPRAEFTRSTCFNWSTVDSDVDQRQLVEEESAIACTPFHFEQSLHSNVERDTEPIMAFLESPQEIVGGVQFSLNQFSSGTMQRFAQHFLSFTSDLLMRPDRPVKDFAVT